MQTVYAHLFRSKPAVRLFLKNNKYFVAFFICLVICASASLLYFDHIVADGDEVSYIDAMKVLTGAPLPPTSGAANFVMHRILTTFLGLETILVLSLVFGKIITAWLAWETLLYFIVSIFFYKLLEKMFKSHKVALVGGLFFATNYAMVTAGLGLFMDIGGWTFYVISIYFLYSYIESRHKRELWMAALSISVGAFFKENALVAYTPLVSILLYENYLSHYSVKDVFSKSFFALTTSFVKQILPLSLAIFIPVAVHHLDVYLVFDHGYLYWVRLNQQTYHYSSRILEYIKSLGSLLTLLIPLSLAGSLVLLKSSFTKIGRVKLFEEYGLDAKRAIFILSVLVSSIPAVLWPGITQRVLFMIVPGLIMISCFFIRRHERYWPAFLVIVAIYAVGGFLMSPYILNLVNLPF